MFLEQYTCKYTLQNSALLLHSIIVSMRDFNCQLSYTAVSLEAYNGNMN